MTTSIDCIMPPDSFYPISVGWWVNNYRSLVVMGKIWSGCDINLSDYIGGEE
jgi:hypothetical protein